MDRGAWRVTIHEVIKESDTTLATKTSLHLKGKKIHLPGVEKFPWCDTIPPKAGYSFMWNSH